MKIERLKPSGEATRLRESKLHNWTRDKTGKTFTLAFNMQGKVIKLELTREETLLLAKSLRKFLLGTPRGKN